MYPLNVVMELVFMIILHQYLCLNDLIFFYEMLNLLIIRENNVYVHD